MLGLPQEPRGEGCQRMLVCTVKVSVGARKSLQRLPNTVRLRVASPHHRHDPVWNLDPSKRYTLGIPELLLTESVFVLDGGQFTPPGCSVCESQSPRSGTRRQISPAQKAARCWGWSSSWGDLSVQLVTPGLLPATPKKQTQCLIRLHAKIF